MDIETSFNEPGELRCSDLELPLLTSESLNEVVMLHLMDIKEKNRTESPLQERNFHTVTEDDVQASLGDSLHLCLGGMSEVAAERSDNTNQLLQLVAGEVAKEVNRKLADITQPSSSRRAEESSECQTDDMVHHVVKILETCQNLPREATKGSLTERQSSKQSLCLTSVTPFQSEKEFPPGEKTCLSVVTDNLPDQVESPEVAPARALKGQQQEATRKALSFVDKVRRYFKRRSSKQAPACEVDTSVPHCEVARLDNGSTPLCQKKPKCPAIIGVLRKIFTCNCFRSQDEN